MASFLISGTHGTDDPTMASLPFIAAGAASADGHRPVIWLWNEAVNLARPGVSDHIVGVNLKPLAEVLADVQAAAIPIWVCSACADARGIRADDLIKGAEIRGMPDYIKAVTKRDHTIAF